MATVFKATRKKPIPKNAEIVERRGKKYAVWKSRGRKRRGELTLDEKSVLVENRNYTVMWFDENGKRRKVNGSPEKDAAEALGRQKETEVIKRRHGIIDPQAEKIALEGRRPIAEHVTDFRAALTNKGDTRDHVDLIIARLNRVIADCGIQRIDNLSPSIVSTKIASLRSGGLSLRTCNGYLGAVKQFSRWLNRDSRTMRDGLAHLTGYKVETDRRRERRVLSADDFRRLVEAAEAGPVVEGVDGPTRGMMYILAGWTGFRRRELSSLTRESFNFKTDPATVTVEASHAKNRRQDTQPLHATVVERLRAWFQMREDHDLKGALFLLQTPGGYWRKTAKMMRADLAKARKTWIGEAKHNPEEQARRKKSDRLKYQDEAGLYADFHAHRHAFVSNLGKVGVSLATAQKLARHSDPKLTSNVYTHLDLSDKASAIQLLPACPGSASHGRQGSSGQSEHDDAELERAYVTEKGERQEEQWGGETGRNAAIDGENVDISDDNQNLPQVVTPSRNRTRRRHVAATGESTPGRIRTCDHRFRNTIRDSWHLGGWASHNARGDPPYGSSRRRTGRREKSRNSARHKSLPRRHVAANGRRQRAEFSFAVVDKSLRDVLIDDAHY